MCERRVFVCLDEYWRDVGVVVREYRRCGNADDEPCMARRRGVGKWAIRIGLCQFYVGVRIPIPVCEYGDVVGIVIGGDRWSGYTDVEPRMAGCRNVGKWEISGGVCRVCWVNLLLQELRRFLDVAYRRRVSRLVVCVDIREWQHDFRDDE